MHRIFEISDLTGTSLATVVVVPIHINQVEGIIVSHKTNQYCSFPYDTNDDNYIVTDLCKRFQIKNYQVEPKIKVD